MLVKSASPITLPYILPIPLLACHTLPLHHSPAPQPSPAQKPAQPPLVSALNPKCPVDLRDTISTLKSWQCENPPHNPQNLLAGKNDAILGVTGGKRRNHRLTFLPNWQTHTPTQTQSIPLYILPAERTKLKELCNIEGIEDPTDPDYLEELIFDSVSPGICMNPDCDYSCTIEPDSDSGYCEECDTNTVKSINMLLGII